MFQTAHDVDRIVEILHYRAFRQFDFDEARIDAGRVNRITDAVLKFTAPELDCRYVDGNRHRWQPLLEPVTVLPARPLQYPFAERNDQAGCFRNRQEHRRIDEANAVL